jgi:hypothetical protein
MVKILPKSFFLPMFLSGSAVFHLMGMVLDEDKGNLEFVIYKRRCKERRG